MEKEYLEPNRGTLLRKNDNNQLKIKIINGSLKDLFLINGKSFLTNNISEKDLIIAPQNYYMLINKGMEMIQINYDHDNSHHEIIYDPYKYEHSKKIKINPDNFINEFDVPKKFIDILPKWYSIKFTYPEYNLIYIKPEMGISIQIHKYRSESWEILGGKPIIINGDKVFYYTDEGTHFTNSINTYHSAINPNKNPSSFVIIKERWSGNFDEEDIKRVFNPNHYT